MRGFWLGLAAILAAWIMVHTAWADRAGLPGQQAVEIVQALEADGAVVTELRWRARIPLGTASTTKELVYLAQNWGKTLSLPRIVRLSRQDNRYVFEHVEEIGGASRLIRLIGLPHGTGWQAYLVVGIEGKRSRLQDALSLLQKTGTSLQQAGAVPQFSTCIRGFYNDTLSDGQQERKIAALLRSLRARETERLQDETVISVSAYTPRWEPVLVSGNRKLNVQAATHVDVHKRFTRITVGTPIITAEY